MTDLVDAEAQRRVTKLIEKITDKRRCSIEPELSKDVKRLCRSSNANISAAFDALSEQLKSNHSQSRLLALELTDELYTRSKHFRSLLAPRFTGLLESTVGFRPEKPLPPPVAAAAALRNRALEVVERWEETFGAFYPQIGLGTRYLKQTLHFSFPQVQARAAADAAALLERQARSERLLEERYMQIKEDFEDAVREMESTLHQMETAIHLLETPAERNIDDIGWEEAGAAADSANHEEDGYGLAAYAAAEIVVPEAASCTASEHVADVSSAASELALLETVRGCYKLIVNRQLPTVQRWLKDLLTTQVGEQCSAEHATKDRLLHRAIDMRASLSEAQGKYESRRTALEAVDEERAAAGGEAACSPAQAASQGSPPGAGQSGALAPGGTQTEQSAEEQAILDSALRHAALRDPALGSNAWTLSSGSLDALPSSARTAKQLAVEAGSRAARLPPEPAPGRSEAAAKHPEGGSSTGAHSIPIQRQRGHTTAPESILRSLLSQAPQVQAGLQLDYWEAGGRVGAARCGMEIQNHWGHVDAHVQLSAEQLDELGVNHVAQYYTASSAKRPVPTAQIAPSGMTPPVRPSGMETDRPQWRRPTMPAVTRIGQRIGSSREWGIHPPVTADVSDELRAGSHEKQLSAVTPVSASFLASGDAAGSGELLHCSADAEQVAVPDIASHGSVRARANSQVQEPLKDSSVRRPAASAKREGGTLVQRLKKFEKSHAEEGPPRSRPSRGFVFIR